MDSNTASQKLQQVDILSFDGGGSRGIMEVSILSDVMRLATIVWRDPENLSYLIKSEGNVSKNQEIREKLVSDLAEVSSPLHPTKMYDMIVGTSTGALIAFGLVGGKENEKGERERERVPMTLEECIVMYQQKTEEIFSKSTWHWVMSYIPGLGSTPFTTYSKDNMQKVLSDTFGESILADFGKRNTITNVAGAVARQIGQKEELVLFDTSTEAYKFYKTHQVLLASSNAPVYFDTPVKIGDKKFVDGGVGGNCPLAQAIPRAKKIYPNKVVKSALSIAPPWPKESVIPHRFQIQYWLNYFVQQSTDGHAVYQDVKRQHRGMINFQRLSPRGEKLQDFKLDEVDANKMLEAMNNEKLSNEMFLVDVIATAMVVVDTYLGKTESPKMTTVKMAAQLAQTAGNIYASQSEYELANNSYKTSIRLRKKMINEDTKVVIAEIYDSIAQCLKNQGKYQRAHKLYELSVDHWKDISGKSDDTNIAKALLNSAHCLLSLYKYEEAQEKFEFGKEMLQRIHGEEADLDVAFALDSIGSCQWKQGKLAEAVDCFSEAVNVKRKVHSSGEHLDIAETRNRLGLCFSDLGRNEEALNHVEDSYLMRKRLIEENADHPKIAESLNCLGFCLLELERFPEAHEKLEDALKMKKRIYGDVDHLSVAVTLDNFAMCLLHEDQHDRALVYVQQALHMKKTCLGNVDNAGIAKTLSIAGICCQKARNVQQADTFSRESKEMIKRLYGHVHVKQVKVQDVFYPFASAINPQHYILKDIVALRLCTCLENLEAE